jgi:hypothetical protein
MRLTGIDLGNPDPKDPAMSLDQISSFTPSEIFHGLILGYLDNPDDYSPEQYLDAFNIAKSAHREVYEAADPAAAAEERRRVVRRLEVEKGSSS